MKKTTQNIFHFNSLFFKLLIYFGTLLIPVLLIAIISYISAVRAVRNEFQGRIAENLKNASEMIDFYVTSAKTTGINFFSYDLVVSYFKPRLQQTLQDKSEQRRIIKLITRSENMLADYIDTVFVYFHDDDVVYTHAGTIEKDFFFQDVYRYTDYDKDYWESIPNKSEMLLILAPTLTNGQWGENSSQVVPIVSTSRINGENASVVLNLSLDRVRRMLEGTAVVDSTRFFILDDNGAIILNTLLLDESEIKRISESTPINGSSILYINKKKYITAQIFSADFGWRYVAISPLNELYAGISIFQQTTFLLTAILIVASIFMSFRYSINIYRPISHAIIALKEKENDLGINILPTDELEFLKEGIEKLSFQKKRYRAQYDLYSNEYIEHAFRLLIEGMQPSQISSLENLLMSVFNFHSDKYCCCTILFDFSSKYFKEILDISRIETSNKLRDILQYILEQSLSCYVMEPQKNAYICVVNDDTDKLLNALETLGELFINDYDYFRISIGIGNFVDNLNEIFLSYNQSMTSLIKQEKEKNFQILKYSDLTVKSHFLYAFLEQQKVINCLKTQNIENLHAAISDILDANFKNGISFENTNLLYQQMVESGLQFLSERRKKIDDLECKQILTQVVNGKKIFLNMGDAKEFLMDFYQEIIFTTSCYSTPKSVNLVEMISKYVIENYTKDLCLEQIADELNVSAKYVSRIFKQKIGVNLTDYINEIRMNKAKELLKTTNMRISEIGPMVGIENRNTFLRVFKKQTGIAPNEYRNS